MICIIPARGGSKRIPHKNIVDFCGKPLIAHSIQNALKSKLFKMVVVSSDDEQILKTARECGAFTPFVRDASLSDDYASSSDVIKDAILRLNELGFKYENVCCLYATAPLIDAEILRNAANDFLAEIKALNEMSADFKDNSLDKTSSLALNSNKALMPNLTSSPASNSNEISKNFNFLFSATEFEYPIWRGFKLLENERVQMFDEQNYFKRSQDLPTAYHDAGAFYFGSKRAWLECDFMFKPYSKAFLLERSLVCDIDTPQDLEFAKMLFKFKENL